MTTIRNLSVFKAIFTRKIGTDDRQSPPPITPENQATWELMELVKWSSAQKRGFLRIWPKNSLLVDARSLLVKLVNVVNEKEVKLKETGRENQERCWDEFPSCITDKLRIIGVLGGEGRGPDMASEASMGAVGLEPTKP